MISYLDTGVAAQRLVAPITLQGGQLVAFDSSSGRLRDAIHRIVGGVGPRPIMGPRPPRRRRCRAGGAAPSDTAGDDAERSDEESGAVFAGDDAERSDRNGANDAGDDAERSDEEERRIRD